MTVQNEHKEAPQHNADKASRGPGELLQDARERLGLSIDDVAQRLCLRIKVIELIEADHYDNFAGLVFTRGYLKAYARFVGLEEKMILEVFDRLGVREHEVEQPIWTSQETIVTYEPNQNKRWLMMGGALLALVFFAGVSMFVGHKKAKQLAVSDTKKVTEVVSSSIKQSPSHLMTTSSVKGQPKALEKFSQKRLAG